VPPSLNFPQLDFVKPSSGFHPVTWERVIILDLICRVLGLPFDPLMKGFFGSLINYDTCFTFGEMSPFLTSPFFCYFIDEY
jgi:hypothetical protein